MLKFSYWLANLFSFKQKTSNHFNLETVTTQMINYWEILIWKIRLKLSKYFKQYNLTNKKESSSSEIHSLLHHCMQSSSRNTHWQWKLYKQYPQKIINGHHKFKNKLFLKKNFLYPSLERIKITLPSILNILGPYFTLLLLVWRHETFSSSFAIPPLFASFKYEDIDQNLCFMLGDEIINLKIIWSKFKLFLSNKKLMIWKKKMQHFDAFIRSLLWFVYVVCIYYIPLWCYIWFLWDVICIYKRNINPNQ